MTRRQLIAKAADLGIEIQIDDEPSIDGVRHIQAWSPAGQWFAGTMTHGLAAGELCPGETAAGYANAWADIERNLPLEPCGGPEHCEFCDDQYA